MQVKNSGLLPKTDHNGSWNGTISFTDSGNWVYNIFFGGDSEHQARSYFDQNNDFLNINVDEGFVDTTPPQISLPSDLIME